MPVSDAWKRVSRQPGVGEIRKLLSHYRVELSVPGAPSSLEFKLYEKQDGRFEAVPSVVLTFNPPKPAVPARPVAKPQATKTPDLPAPSASHESEQEALSQTLQTLIQMSRLKNACWEPNPSF